MGRSRINVSDWPVVRRWAAPGDEEMSCPEQAGCWHTVPEHCAVESSREII